MNQAEDDKRIYRGYKMGDFAEVTVVLKDADKRVTQKFLCYENLINEEYFLPYITETKKNFTGDPESVIVKITIVVQ